MEEQEATKEETSAFADKIYCRCDPDNSLMPSGQIAGMIEEILDIPEVVNRLFNEAKTLSARVSDFFKED